MRVSVVIPSYNHAAFIVKAIESVLDGLSNRGKLMLVAAAHEPFAVNAFPMLTGKMIHGWPSGSAVDSEDAMSFSALADVRPQIEKFPLEQVNEGFELMEKKDGVRSVIRFDA